MDGSCWAILRLCERAIAHMNFHKALLIDEGARHSTWIGFSGDEVVAVS